MPGWLADFFRFWWGLLYWNTRKTVFRWRGGRCPCQHPSDSGRGLETACVACANWNQPARFQRVCPLLVTMPHGLRCSVNTHEVRPFWGRAAGFYGGAVGALYLAAVLGVFALLRGIGYPVQFRTVAWPRAWPEIRAARAEYFYKIALHALNTNQTKEGMLALAYAYELNPRNYQAGLLLAKLWQAPQPTWSDFIYARLLRDDTAEPAAIAEEWYRAMLARGDFAKIAEAAPGFLVRDAAHTPIWIHALFFSTRRLGDSGPLRQLLANDPSLAPGLRRLVEIELLAETGRANDAHEALLSLRADSPYAAYYQVSELTALGFPDEALAAIDGNAGLLPPRDGFALRLDAFATHGWSSLGRNQVELVLSAPASTSSVELLCAYFIRHPDAKLLATLFDQLGREPLPSTPGHYPAILALFCAAGVDADWDDLRTAHNLLRQLGTPSRNILDVAEAFFRGQSAQQRLGSILPLFQPPPFEVSDPATNGKPASPAMLQPLSLDVTYALFEHYRGNQTTPAP
jgi:hypothetical protein